jgi:hypothetical protein
MLDRMEHLQGKGPLQVLMQSQACAAVWVKQIEKHSPLLLLLLLKRDLNW